MRFTSLVHDKEFQEAAHVAVTVHGDSQQKFAVDRGVSVGTVCRALAARRERLNLPREQPQGRKRIVKFHQLDSSLA